VATLAGREGAGFGAGVSVLAGDAPAPGAQATISMLKAAITIKILVFMGILLDYFQNVPITMSCRKRFPRRQAVA
jgi:hypothetical protein